MDQGPERGRCQGIARTLAEHDSDWHAAVETGDHIGGLLPGLGEFVCDAAEAGRDVATGFRVRHQGSKEPVCAPAFRNLFLEEPQHVVGLAARARVVGQRRPIEVTGLPFEGLGELVAIRFANRFVERLGVEESQSHYG